MATKSVVPHLAPAPGIQVFVETLSGSIISLSLEPDLIVQRILVWHVKEKLNLALGLPEIQQELIFKNTKLFDWGTLMRAKVTDGSTLQLVVKPVEASALAEGE
jgi:hypothetical protein